jgi:hypothetical protein
LKQTNRSSKKISKIEHFNRFWEKSRKQAEIQYLDNKRIERKILIKKIVGRFGLFIICALFAVASISSAE